LIGNRLGVYEITAQIGEGGMGRVYKARDSQLGRDVALKVLPEGLTQDAERLARFEREAKLLASLNHPNIAHIYGLETSGGSPALVMELVEGPTLADRLAQGSLSITESLSIARQIAEALEEAHEKGIVHRDLKPQNVKASIEGKVKVLDFGLAKAMEPTGAASASGTAPGGAVNLTYSPTLTSPAMGATVAGVILGTAAYMSPEQARGGAVDERADIWAFGVVLYEMLCGARLFASDTVSDTLAGVLKTEIDFGALPEETPPAVRRLLKRCLERNPKNRLHSIADARIVLDEIARGPAEAPPEALAAAGSSGRSAVRWLTWAGLLAAGLLAGWGLTQVAESGSAARHVPVRARLTVALPADAPLAAGNFLPSLAFSPDGASLAYVAVGADGVRRLAVRRLDSAEVRVIPGTEGAEGPFFSPDGQWIAFWSKWRVRKVRASGLGVPEVVCSSLDFRGGTWAGHTIVFSPSQTRALLQVDDGGGTPHPLTELRPGEDNHRFPHVLPDGDTILFSAWKAPFDLDRATLWALSLATGKRKAIGTTSQDVLYSPTGHLLYVQAGRLLAEPFDPVKLEITGPATAILDHVVVQKNTGAAQFAVSSTGELAWAAGDLVGDKVRLVRVDRGGAATPFYATDTPRRWPVLSPDDRSLLVYAIGTEVEGEWLMSVDGSTRRRASSEAVFARWLPDGRWVFADITNSLSVDSLDGSSPRQQLVTPQPNAVVPTGVSPEGTVAYDTIGPKGDLDAWQVDVKSGKPRPYLDGPASEGGVTFSPDGRYIAYISDQSGDFEVYVASYPDRSATWQISTAGGSEVVWRRDGREIVFRSGSELMAVPVTTEPAFHAGSPTVLFQLPYDGVLGSPDLPNYDESRDGSWFLMTGNPDLNQPAAAIQIAFDWPTVLSGK
jgi:Tol biopolymer transport system component